MQFSDIKLGAKKTTVTLLPHTGSNTRKQQMGSQPIYWVNHNWVVLTPDQPPVHLNLWVCFSWCWCHLDIIRKKSTCVSLFVGHSSSSTKWPHFQMMRVQNEWWHMNTKNSLCIMQKIKCSHRGSKHPQPQDRQRRKLQTCRAMGETGCGWGNKMKTWGVKWEEEKPSCSLAGILPCLHAESSVEPARRRRKM